MMSIFTIEPMVPKVGNTTNNVLNSKIPTEKAVVKVLLKDMESDANSFHRAIYPVLIVAQFFGLMPLTGITANNATHLKFSWFSFRVFYTLFLMIGVVILSTVYVINLLTIASLNRSTAIIFSTTGFICVLFFFHLSTKWPSLMAQLHELEISMKLNYGYPRRLARNMRMVVAFILALSCVEHILANLKSLRRALDCFDGAIFPAFQMFYSIAIPIVVGVVGYSPLVGIIYQQIVFVITFSWNYMDVFIIMYSMMLTSRFKQINERLNKARGNLMPDSFWRQIREDYNNLSMFVKISDNHINKIVLLSFGNNLYFICWQLLNSLKPGMSSEDMIYFYVSFGHLLIRCITMCLCAASIHEQSKEPTTVLFAVPSECYSQEIQRFIIQVTTDHIALTGLKFFSVTKTLLLTVIGTVVTYEIVLMQTKVTIDEDAGHSLSHSNSTHRVNPYCPNKTIHYFI